MRWLVLRPLPSLSPHRPPAACSPTTSNARSDACRAGIVAADFLSLRQASRSWTSVLHQSRRTAASSRTAHGEQPRPVLAGAAQDHPRRASSVRIDWSERRWFELACHIVISKGIMTRFSHDHDWYVHHSSFHGRHHFAVAHCRDPLSRRIMRMSSLERVVSTFMGSASWRHISRVDSAIGSERKPFGMSLLSRSG